MWGNPDTQTQKMEFAFKLLMKLPPNCKMPRFTAPHATCPINDNLSNVLLLYCPGKAYLLVICLIIVISPPLVFVIVSVPSGLCNYFCWWRHWHHLQIVLAFHQYSLVGHYWVSIYRLLLCQSCHSDLLVIKHFFRKGAKKVVHIESWKYCIIGIGIETCT